MIVPLGLGQRFFSVVFLVSVFLCSPVALAGETGKKPGVFPLHTTDGTLASSELEPLKTLVGDAHFVGLGESVHTSGGYYRSKVSMMRFLIEEMGFRIVAFETRSIAAEAVNQYVQGGPGTAAQALHGFFPIWRDECVESFLEFVRDFNARHVADPVTVMGFDIQQVWDDGKRIRAFIDDVHATARERWKEDLAQVPGATAVNARAADGEMSKAYVPNGKYFTLRRYARGMQAVTEIEEYIEKERAALEEKVTTKQLAEVEAALVSFRAQAGTMYLSSHYSHPSVYYMERDLAMAQSLLNYRNRWAPGAKVVLWAHNVHLMKNGENALRSGPTMGGHLKKALGADFVNIGLIAHRVEINWPRLDNKYPPLPPDPGLAENILNGAGYEAALVDLSTDALPAGTKSLVWDGDSTSYPLTCAEQFNAILFLKHSPPMRYAKGALDKSP